MLIDARGSFRLLPVLTRMLEKLLGSKKCCRLRATFLKRILCYNPARRSFLVLDSARGSFRWLRCLLLLIWHCIAASQRLQKNFYFVAFIWPKHPAFMLLIRVGLPGFIRCLSRFCFPRFRGILTLSMKNGLVPRLHFIALGK